VLAGGSDSNTTVSSGGIQYNYGLESATTVGGLAVVYGTANSTTITSHGLEYIESAGKGSGTLIASAGSEYVLAGGSNSSTTVSSGGEQVVYGMANSVTIKAGGYDYVESGGKLSNAGISGTLYVEPHGSATGGTVAAGGVVVDEGITSSLTLNGGEELVESAGIASGTIVNSGGRGYVLSGGSAVGLTVNSGTALLSSGAAAGGTLFASGAGGKIEIAGVVNGASVAEVGNGVVDILGSSGERVTFQSGGSGELELDVLGSAYSGQVSGFGQNTKQLLDLTKINSAGATLSYASAAGNTSGTLTVTSGGISVSIKLIGTYTSNSFTISHDPGNHVEIIDPPVVAKGGFATPATLGYAGIVNPTESLFTAGENRIANVPLLQQQMAAQFAPIVHDHNTLVGAAAVSGSTALLAHGHG
jgi:autotransporter passenger strand-loop-strand repeat protein